MITLSAITREGVTFLEDMFASRAESISGGAKLFTSLRLFKWDTLLNFSVQFLAVGNNSSIILDEELDVPAHQSDRNWSRSAPDTGKFLDATLRSIGVSHGDLVLVVVVGARGLRGPI